MYHIPYPYEKEPEKLSAKKLKEIIDSGLRIESSYDKIDIYLPFHFEDISSGKSEELLRITFRRIPTPNVNSGPLKQRVGNVDDTKYPTYEISDNGRAFEELEKKVGSVHPYAERVEKLLDHYGMLQLRGGRIIIATYSATSIYCHTSVLNDLLSAVTTIANFDILPPYCESKH